MTGSAYGDYNRNVTLNPISTGSSGRNVKELEEEEQSLFLQTTFLEQEESYSNIENDFIESSSARIEQLNSQKTDIMSDISTMQTDVNDLSTSISEQNQTISTISQNLNSLTAPNKNDYAVTNEENGETTYPGYVAALAEYNEQLAQLEEELSTAESELDSLTTDLETAQTNLESLSDTLNEVTQELQELQDLKSEENNNKNDNTSKDDEVQAEIAALQEQLSTVQTELAAAKEAEAAAQAKAEESKTPEGDSNLLDSTSGLMNTEYSLNNLDLSSFDNNSEEETKTVSLDDITELANNARTLINSSSYDDESYQNALSNVLDTIDTVNNSIYDTDDEYTKNYINLVNDLDELITERESPDIVESGNSEEAEDTTDTDESSEKRTEEEIEDDIQSEITEMYKSILNLDDSDSSDVISNAIALAYSLVGTEEANGNNDGADVAKIIEACGGTPGDESTEGDAWCVFFTNYLYGVGQMMTSDELAERELFDTSLSSCNVAALKEEAIEKGYFKDKDDVDSETGETYEPAAGDIIVLNENNASHVGLVVYSDDNYVYTIEGNADDKVRMKKYDKTCTESNKYEDVTGYISMSEIYGGNTSSVNLNYINEEDFELAVKGEDTR
ncbi:MAG: CHAP domain-containing protein [Candidatus Gastranaerophilales bacterium]|nr:CHAP domain-containing protein [Candidatus Gastranaerophilales bacterium]